MMNYWINLQAQSVNKNPGIKLLSQVGNMGKTKSFLFGWDSMEVAKEMGLNNKLFNEAVPLAVTPPQLFPLVLVDLIIWNYMNITNMSGIIEDRIMSMETGKMGFGVFVPELGISMKKTTTDHLSISTVELMAIIAALYWIEERGTKKVIICSDSSSALVSISRYHQRTGRFAYMKYMNNIKIVQNNLIKEWQYTWDREVTGRH